MIRCGPGDRLVPLLDAYAPTIAAAHARIAAVRPNAYARTRNALDGAVSGLSPYITHGLVSLTDVLAGVAARHPLAAQHKFVYELGWRAYFRHVWDHRGDGILESIHEGSMPDAAYATELPADIRQGCTGIPVIDQAVRTLYDTGMLHNHARMWLASYVVHVRKVHWRCGANWLYGHLLDGDLASNHLSWQWVAGTGSHKPYLFNADNVARYAPVSWHSPGSVIDVSYEALDQLTRQPAPASGSPVGWPCATEPPLAGEPPQDVGAVAPDPNLVKGRQVWLVHPWNLGRLPELPHGTLVLGVFVSEFHRTWPWSDRRWRFVAARMAELTSCCWHGDAASIQVALEGAQRVSSVEEPHLSAWLPSWAECDAAPTLFAPVDRRCDSFSQWWTRASPGLSRHTAG
nr:FAD-binding domain-containing protein [Caenimonas sp. SL110]